MRKNYLLSVLLLILISTGMVNAAPGATYNLHELTEDQFKAGGGTYWQFEKYDMLTGKYTVLSTNGDDGKVNYFDKFNPERFGSYPIMNNSPVNSYVKKRNSWYDSAGEYVYVARDYDKGTECVNLVYGTTLGWGSDLTIPDTLMGYEVYSGPVEGGGVNRNSAITFKVPSTGYYKVDMSVIREDHIFTPGMSVIPRYRYNFVDKVSDISRINCGIFNYGEGDGSSFGNDVTPPEFPVQEGVSSGYGAGRLRCMPQNVKSHSFYVYAKAGDAISFEVDAREMPSAKDPRDVWSRTKWTKLILTEVDQAVAEAAGDNYCNPYAEVPGALNRIGELLNEIAILLESDFGNSHTEAAKTNLSEINTEVKAAYDTNVIMPMDAVAYISELETAKDIYVASEKGLKVQYDFENVSGNIVPDASGSGYDATLYDQAKVVKMGKYHVLSLGDAWGYLDMGEELGKAVYSMDDYTISTYYRVDENATLDGDGFFLWMIATQAVTSANEGQFIFYQLNNQKYAVSEAGHVGIQSVSRDQMSERNTWKHVVFRQRGAQSELWVDGVKVKDGSLAIPATNFKRISNFNWIGRPAFYGDNYLRKTLVYDFRLYNEAVEDDDIAAWAELLPELEQEYKYGEVGDFTQLNELIGISMMLLSKAEVGTGIGQFPSGAFPDFEDAVTAAQDIVAGNRASQFLIDTEYENLKKAYDDFVATAGTGMVYPQSAGASEHPFESGVYYIQVDDYFLTVSENGDKIYLTPYTDNPTKIKNNQVWNVQYNDVKSELDGISPYALFSLVSDVTNWDMDGNYHMNEIGQIYAGNTVDAQAELNGKWSYSGYMLYYNGIAHAIVNHNEGKAVIFDKEVENETAISSDDKKFQFVFRTVDSVVADPSNPIKEGLVSVNDVNDTPKAKIYGVKGAFVVEGTDAGDMIEVYDISGRLLKTVQATGEYTRVENAAGLYLVKIPGQVNKVIVR